MSKAKRPNLQKVIHAANRRGLFVLAEGEGLKLHYRFFDRNTGRVALIYYPSSGHWMAGGRDGKAINFQEALDKVFQ